MINQFEQFKNKGYVSGAAYPVPKWIATEYQLVHQAVKVMSKDKAIKWGMDGAIEGSRIKWSIANLWADLNNSMTNTIKQGHKTISTAYHMTQGIQGIMAYTGLGHDFCAILCGLEQADTKRQVKKHTDLVAQWLKAETSSDMIKQIYEEYLMRQSAPHMRHRINKYNAFSRATQIMQRAYQMEGIILDIHDVYTHLIEQI